MIPWFSPELNSQELNKDAFVYYSQTIRDTAPSYEEYSQFKNGTKSLEDFISDWLISPEHDERIRRFFYDMVGVPALGVVTSDEYGLLETDTGILYLTEKGSCSLSESSLSDAWWSDSNVRICNHSISSQLEYGTPNTADHLNCTWANASKDSRCGCGPELIRCRPKAIDHQMQIDSMIENIERGLDIYKTGKTWSDYLAGSTFYTTRYLYFLYLLNGLIRSDWKYPSTEQITALKATPIASFSHVAWPTEGYERAPIVTNPAYMLLYNNFRTRVRHLSETFLCQEITPALNTDGINEIVNTDLDFASHGTTEGCAGCHYVLDNWATTIMGWTQLGRIEGTVSQLGHVFGERGTGPMFLMQSLVSRGPTFHRCMAKRAWENFTASPFASLSEEQRNQLTTWSELGPQNLISNMIGADFYDLSAQNNPENQECESGMTAFESQIRASLENNCITAGCHVSQKVAGILMGIDQDQINRGALLSYINNGSIYDSAKLISKLSLDNTTHGGGDQIENLPASKIEIWITAEQTCLEQ